MSPFFSLPFALLKDKPFAFNFVDLVVENFLKFLKDLFKSLVKLLGNLLYIKGTLPFFSPSFVVPVGIVAKWREVEFAKGANWLI